MLAQTGFPEYLESIAVGPDVEFLKQNTNLCHVANEFPQEINLTYLWKQTYTSPDMIVSVREFAKHFLLDAPDLTDEMLMFYVRRVNMLPGNVRNVIVNEVDLALTKSTNIQTNYTFPTIITETHIQSRNFNKRKPLDIDLGFLDKLAALMNSCKSACNYFKSVSDKIGSVADFSRANSIHSSVPNDSGVDAPPPTGIGLNIFNKIPALIQESVTKAYTSAKMLTDAAKYQFSDPDTAAQLERMAKEGIAADSKGMAYRGSTTPSNFQDIMRVHSKVAAKNRRRLGDCYRMVDQMNRYNSFDSAMNIAKSSPTVFEIQAPHASTQGDKITYQINSIGMAANRNGVVVNPPDPRNVLSTQLQGKYDDAYTTMSTTSSVSGIKLNKTLPTADPLKLNVRSNNWGNLHIYNAADPYNNYPGQTGIVDDVKDGEFRGSIATFATPEDGVTANMKQLQRSISRTGTIESLAAEWTGNTPGYADVWSKASGIPKNEPLNYNDKNQMANLYAGIVYGEGGGLPPNFTQVFDTGYDRAKAYIRK